jgi:class 3 adenylate cyclase/HAMP domain-containing protein
VRIKGKVVLVVLPLIVAPLCILAIASTSTARAAVRQSAAELLQFKIEQLTGYAQGQWALLEENALTEGEEYRALTRDAVAGYARSLVGGRTEIAVAVDASGRLVWQTGTSAIAPGEALALTAVSMTDGWAEARLGGSAWVGFVGEAPAWGWRVFYGMSRADFDAAGTRILVQGAVVVGASALAAVALLFLLSGVLTRPLASVVAAMRRVISSRDLSQRVALLYRDETGELGHTFNLMTGELERAYGQIKGYALQSAIARTREEKVRHIFQKYVPKEVIEEFFQNPERMLVGQTRELAILFSDIRGFTAISERMQPEQVVESLNAYFALMVDVITAHSGIVDKYMGDAVMAFFGAPIHHGDDPLRAVRAGLEMLDALERFNGGQKAKGRPEFRIGIGINFGPVVVGNIGSEKKMDYTVVGDIVNLASRMEGLTKVYHEPILFPEPVYRAVQDSVPCRRLDRVAVRGATKSIVIYTARSVVTPEEQNGWRLHHEGLELYYRREFAGASAAFAEALTHLPGDRLLRSFAERCAIYERTPPGPGWTGVVAFREK